MTGRGADARGSRAAEGAAGEVCLWQDTRVGTTLRFVYLRSREHDPLIRALLDVVTETWRLRRDAGPAARRKVDRQTADPPPASAVPAKESPS